MDKIEERLKTVEGRCDTFDKQLRCEEAPE